MSRLTAGAILAGIFLMAGATSPDARPGTSAAAAKKAPTPTVAAPSSEAPAQSFELLPDSTLLARVDDRVIRAGEFAERYKGADPFTRPAQDSAGRVEFLSSLVDGLVLGITARELQPPLELEDRIRLRDITNDLLTTTLHRRTVVDPVKVTLADLNRLYGQYSYDIQLRCIIMGDRAEAERVRMNLLRGRLTWTDAVARYSRGSAALGDSGTGWMHRIDFTGPGSISLWNLEPSQISEVVDDVEGVRLWQCIGRRPAADPPPYSGVRLAIARDLRASREAPLYSALFQKLRERAKSRLDTANVIWLAERFVSSNRPLDGTERPILDITSRVPILAPQDTGRVLAWAHGSAFSANEMLARYKQVHSYLRRKVTGPAVLADIVERMVLEDDMVALAREEGLEHDPEVVAEIDRQREGMMVEHLYSDSVLAHIRVDATQRRSYYEAHREVLTVPGWARFVMLIRGTEAGADSVLAQLAGGMRAEQIALADSLAGMNFGAVQRVKEDEPHAYREVLFAELAPGQSTKVHSGGPWVVIHLLERQDKRQQTYEEAADTVDQALQAAEAERLLAEWMTRLRQRHRIEWHPELVMRVQMQRKPPETVLPSE